GAVIGLATLPTRNFVSSGEIGTCCSRSANPKPPFQMISPLYPTETATPAERPPATKSATSALASSPATSSDALTSAAISAVTSCATTTRSGAHPHPATMTATTIPIPALLYFILDLPAIRFGHPHNVT